MTSKNPGRISGSTNNYVFNQTNWTVATTTIEKKLPFWGQRARRLRRQRRASASISFWLIASRRIFDLRDPALHSPPFLPVLFPVAVLILLSSSCSASADSTKAQSLTGLFHYFCVVRRRLLFFYTLCSSSSPSSSSSSSSFPSSFFGPPFFVVVISVLLLCRCVTSELLSRLSYSQKEME